MIGYEEKALCRKIAKAFEIGGKNGCEISTFIKAWLNSQTALKIYNRDFNEIAQSGFYVFNSLKQETVLTNIYKNDNYYIDVFFWAGYIITYLQFYLNVPPIEIWNKYDILAFVASYDVLHTLSNNNAAEEFIHEYKK